MGETKNRRDEEARLLRMAHEGRWALDIIDRYNRGEIDADEAERLIALGPPNDGEGTDDTSGAKEA